MMSDDQALDQLQQILSRAEFQTKESEPCWQQLLAGVATIALNLLAQAYEAITSAASGHEGWFGLAALVVGGVVAVAVGLYLARSIRLAVVRGSRAAAESRAERRDRSDRLWETAQRLARAGDWPAALRAAYLSALYALDEHALLHVESGLTNLEHARRLAREHPELGSPFAELVQRYDRLRYGRAPITAEAFAELSALVAQARSTQAVRAA
jgi:Domain of unknown function (DUF4129)